MQSFSSMLIMYVTSCNSAKISLTVSTRHEFCHIYSRKATAATLLRERRITWHGHCAYEQAYEQCTWLTTMAATMITIITGSHSVSALPSSLVAASARGFTNSSGRSKNCSTHGVARCHNGPIVHYNLNIPQGICICIWYMHKYTYKYKSGTCINTHVHINIWYMYEYTCIYIHLGYVWTYR